MSSILFSTLNVALLAVLPLAAVSCVESESDVVGEAEDEEEVDLDDGDELAESEMDDSVFPLTSGGIVRWLNVYAFYGSSTTSAYFSNSGLKPVKTVIKYQTDKATGTGLTIELRKSGVSYGTYSVWATPSPQYFDRTWAGSAQAGNFYVVIKKKGLLPGSDIVSGYFNMTNP